MPRFVPPLLIFLRSERNGAAVPGAGRARKRKARASLAHHRPRPLNVTYGQRDNAPLFFVFVFFPPVDW